VWQATHMEVVTGNSHVVSLFHAMLSEHKRVRCARKGKGKKEKKREVKKSKEKKRTNGGRYQDACLECENSRKIMAILKVFLREAGRTLSRKAKEH